MEDKKTKEIYFIDKDLYIKQGQELIISDKLVFVKENIKCEGTLVIDNCNIIYGGEYNNNCVIMAKLGAKVSIRNCNIIERGSHMNIFFMAGYSYLHSEQLMNVFNIKYDFNKIDESSLSKYHKEKEYIKVAYGKLENQVSSDDTISMDKIVIENCIFSNEKSLYEKILKPVNSGLLKPYIVLECGGIIKKCVFNIDTKCNYGIIRGTHNPRVFLHKVKGDYTNPPRCKSYKGEDIEYYNLSEDKKPRAVNVLKARKYRQTKVIDCEFNNSHLAVFSNCQVENCIFNNCNKAIQDVYDVNNCTFNNCENGIVRNEGINVDNACERNVFNGCKSQITDRENMRTKLKNKIEWKYLGYVPVFLFLIYAVYTAIRGHIRISNMSGIKLEKDLLIFSIFSIILVIYRINEAGRTILSEFRTGIIHKGIIKTLSVVVYQLTLIAVALYVLVYYGASYYHVKKDGMQVIETNTYKLKAVYVDEYHEKITIKEEEIDNYKDYTVRFYISDDDYKFEISKDKFDEVRNSKGNIKIYYYKRPLKYVGIEIM